MNIRNILAGAAVVATLGGATGASAATVALGGTGTLTPAGLSSIGHAAKGATIDDIFTFTVSPPPEQAYAQLQASLTAASGLFTSGTIGFYSGAPGSGALIGSLASIVNYASPYPQSDATTGTFNLTPGHNYYVEVKGTANATKGVNYSVSVFGAAVPEPATWAMLIGGLGMIGASLRMSRRSNKGLATA